MRFQQKHAILYFFADTKVLALINFPSVLKDFSSVSRFALKGKKNLRNGNLDDKSDDNNGEARKIFHRFMRFMSAYAIVT